MACDVRVRDARWEQLENSSFDVVVIGGGITGASTFASLAAAGYKVLLIDRGDFGSATSQSSGMMIWGGLLYLKNLDLHTVFRLCRIRDRLIEEFPDEIGAQYYGYLPARTGWRTPAVIRLVLEFYRLLAGYRRGRVRAESAFPEAQFLRMEQFRGSLFYEEAMLTASDSLLVVNIIRRHAGATAVPMNYARLEDVRFDRQQHRWRVALADTFADHAVTLSARSVVNCGGPYADAINQHFGISTPYRHALSKGVYINLKRPAGHDHPLIFEMGRAGDVLTLVPWGPVSLWGPTETLIDDVNAGFAPSLADVEFLLAQANRNLNYRVTARDIISYRAGVRALAVPADYHAQRYPLELSRRYRVHLVKATPWVTVYGGKLTSGELMGGRVLQKLRGVLGPAPDPPQRPDSLPPVRDRMRFPGLAGSWPSIAHCVQHEYCLTIEDYLRRRTNIAQWLPRGGLGRENENRDLIRRLTAELPLRSGVQPAMIVDSLIAEADRVQTQIYGLDGAGT
jgi:glycerol-3-phosphate dehydrogenase